MVDAARPGWASGAGASSVALHLARPGSIANSHCCAVRGGEEAWPSCLSRLPNRASHTLHIPRKPSSVRRIIAFPSPFALHRVSRCECEFCWRGPCVMACLCGQLSVALQQRIIPFNPATFVHPSIPGFASSTTPHLAITGLRSKERPHAACTHVVSSGFAERLRALHSQMRKCRLNKCDESATIPCSRSERVLDEHIKAGHPPPPVYTPSSTLSISRSANFQEKCILGTLL